MGVKDKEDDGEAAPVEGDEKTQEDYRASAQYASSMTGKSKAVSDFAKSKTMKEQRESLPIYTVRDELLDVLRENRAMIVVGETGSGASARRAAACSAISTHATQAKRRS